MTESGGLRAKLKGKRGTTATSAIDELTGLPDRTNLRPWAAEALQRAKQTSSRCAIAFVSVGELREVNDIHGPTAGDDLLKAVATRLGSIDLPDTRVLRYQGSEFAVILERLPNPEAAETTGAFLIELMGEPFETGAGILTVPAHAGIAVSSDAYDVVEDLLRDAHEAVVAARAAGPNAYRVHDETKRMLHTTRIDEHRLQDAIDEGEFLLHYQPIVRLDTSEVVGVEALIRWQMPGATNLGLIYPHDFMPLLERSGMAPQVGNWVVDAAIRQISRWQRDFPEHRVLLLTVNVGPHQLAASGFAEAIDQALTATTTGDGPSVEAWQLCLDLTEEALRYNRNASWVALRDVKQLGVRLGLDDFGTGESSLLYLRELALDFIRIDPVFVGGVEHNAEDRAIVRHIAAMAHELELITIAEGVETLEQAAGLRELGVDLAQGYHFGRPGPAKEFAERLRPEGQEAPKTWQPDQVYSFEEQ